MGLGYNGFAVLKRSPNVFNFKGCSNKFEKFSIVEINPSKSARMIGLSKRAKYPS
ncbi:MAG: hypothetical protein KA797_06560 [Chitinophagales bacterium]|nr:hypothetical protein [Chitinophagales bacterium]